MSSNSSVSRFDGQISSCQDCSPKTGCANPALCASERLEDVRRLHEAVNRVAATFGLPWAEPWDELPKAEKDCLAVAVKQVFASRSETREPITPSFVNMRISYRGFSYGMGSEKGISSLRRAIEERGDY